MRGSISTWVLSYLVCGALICLGADHEISRPQITRSSDAKTLKTTSGAHVAIHHALRGEEKRQWENLESHILPYLEMWERAGVRLDHGIRIFLEPEPGLDRTQVLRQLYGAGIEKDLRLIQQKAEQTLATRESVQELIDFLKIYECKYPPLFTGFLGTLESDFNKIPENGVKPEFVPKFKDFLRGSVEMILDPGKPLPGFGKMGARAYFNAYPPGTCMPFATLARADNVEQDFHAFEEIDIVLHEIGHALHYEIWDKIFPHSADEVVNAPNALTEAAADIFAHAYLRTPGHGRYKKPNSFGQYRRMMDSHDRDLLHSLRGNTHEDNAAVRHFFWDAFRQSKDREKTARAFVSGLGEALSERNPVYPENEYMDGFMRDYRFFHENFDAFKRLVEAYCAKDPSPVCARKMEYVGSVMGDPLAGIRRFAPSTIGKKGLKTALDGEPVTIRFYPGHTSPKVSWNSCLVVIEKESGERREYNSSNEGQSGEFPHHVKYTELQRDGEPSLYWTSQGVILSKKPQ